MTEAEKEQMDEVFEYEQGVSDNLEVTDFGRRDIKPGEIYNYLFNLDTVDKVLQDLMKNGLKIHGGETIGKTIIFAYNHQHAVLIVKRFNELFPQYGSEFCMLIDNTVNYSQDLINRFEVRDKEPQITVSVDMLDTGIDVPDILNLVFFKVVKSKIKFQQMIGRGTRLSEDIFGKGENKTKFLIFDYCNNFEYFNLNFKQAKQVRILSLTEKLFNLKLQIAVALQALPYQEDEYLKSLHDRLKAELRSQIETLNRSHIDVRSEWQLVDQYSTEKAWEYVSPVESLDIQNHISPLLQPNLEDENAKRFDLLMLWIELSVIDKEVDASKTVSQVVQIAEVLSEKMSIPQVLNKKATIQEVQTEKFWEHVTVSELERVREELRDLMKFLTGTEKRTFEINIVDEFTDKGEVTQPKFQLSYKQRVIDYLSENSDNPVLQKIKNLEQLTFHDVNELERVLWEELGNKTEYENYTKNMLCGGNVAVFIRSLIGIDRETALKKFSQFIDANTLNSLQQEYLKSILDYVSVNGDISGEIITKTEPFNEFDWQKVYGNNVAFIANYVNQLHQVVTTA